MSGIAVVFPGQGSQRRGMAQDFCETYQESRDVFARASSALNLDVQDLCFNDNANLNQTEYTQPAILTVEIAILEAVKKNFEFAPELFGGHSLGEYTALVAAEVMSLEDAVRIVRKRGALMQAAVPLGVGAMAALILEDIAETGFAEVAREAGAEIANYNSTSQVVISGGKESVELASKRIKENFPEMTIIPLNVSAPFHSSLMKGIEAEFAAYLNSFNPKFNLEGASRVLSNFSGEFHSPDSLLTNLVNQISGSVRWLRNMEVVRQTADTVYEIGPARILSKFFSSVGVTAKAVTDLRTLRKSMES